jgi:hypothetical protein
MIIEVVVVCALEATLQPRLVLSAWWLLEADERLCGIVHRWLSWWNLAQMPGRGGHAEEGAHHVAAR